MSEPDASNPFDEGETAAEPTSPVASTPLASHSPSATSSFLTASTTSMSSSPPSPQSLASALSAASHSAAPSKPTELDTAAATNGYHDTTQHEKETLFDHLKHADPAPSNDDTSPSSAAPTTPGPEPLPAQQRLEDSTFKSAEPALFLDFRLAVQLDSYADVLDSLSSLTSSLTALQAQYSTHHTATIAASLDEQRQYQQQQSDIRADITALRAKLDALEHTKTSTQQQLDTLHHSVSTKTQRQHELTSQLATLTQHHSDLSRKLSRRQLPQQRNTKLRLHIFTLRPPTPVQRRLAAPAAAVDGIFACLTVREVESAVRTCKRWQWVVERSGVWKSGLRRIAGNKRRKEREREETGQQQTRDEFDEWTDRANERVGEEQDGELDGDGDAVDSPSNKRKDDSALNLTPAAAAALNLPPVDSPVPDHLHYALTVDLTKDLYTVSITSRRITTLYQCAGCMDSLTPGQPSAALPKTSSLVICCTLVPAAASVTELQFCEQMMGMQEQMAVAKQDVQRLLVQVKEDGEVKRRLQAELAEREAELRVVQAELDFSMQQQMSDEMTRQFIEDSVTTTREQLDEERQQTTSLRTMLRDAYTKREAEVSDMEREAEGMVAVVDGLKEEKSKLTRDVKRLQSELEAVTGERERAKREYERLMELVEQLRAL